MCVGIIHGNNSDYGKSLSAIVPCPTLNSPSNSNQPQIAQDDASGYIYNITYTCEDDFFLDGAATIHCNNLGQWTDLSPICQREISFL